MGRPKNPTPKTEAQRKAEYRAKKAAQAAAPSPGSRIIEGAKQALAIAQGEDQPERVTVKAKSPPAAIPFTVPKVRERPKTLVGFHPVTDEPIYR